MKRPPTALFAATFALLLALHVPPVTPANAAPRHSLCSPQGNYGDVAYADPGYQQDGRPRYPIDTEKHIRAAWSYIHQARNRSMYTSTQAAQIEAKIIAAWKKAIDPDGPPSAETATGK